MRNSSPAPSVSRCPAALRACAVVSGLALIGLLLAPPPGGAADEKEKEKEPQSAPAPPKAAALTVAELKRETPVDFEQEILPVLKNNCLACHNTTKAKGGLNLETPQLIRKGGDSGPAVEPGKSAGSLIFKAAAHLDPELIMPPKDNKANASELKPEQLALLKLWIDQGAKGEVRASMPVNWLEHPPRLEPILAVALTRDGQYAACGRGNEILVYHVPTGQPVARLADPKFSGATGLNQAAHRDQVSSLAFNAEGTLLASSAFREVKLWRRPPPSAKAALATEETTRAIAVSPDRKWLAAVTDNDQIHLHDLLRGQKVHTLAGHTNAILALAFSSDSRRLASSAADRTVRVWNVADGQANASIVAPTNVPALAWLGEGTQLAGGDESGRIQIWDLAGAELKPARDWNGHAGAVTALALLPNQQLLSGGRDGLVRQWEIAHAKAVRELKQESAVVAIAVRPDGKRAALAGTNRLIRLWNLDDGKSVAELKGDRYADDRVAESERALAIAKVTAEFHKKSLETSEAEAKKQHDRVATATATNTFTEKVFLEKEKALKEAQEAKAKAEKDLQELLAHVQKVTEEYERADQAAKQAATTAKSAAEKAAQAQLAADRASLARADAQRISADAAAVAARTRATVDNADAAKETARRIAEESAAVAEKSKGFAEAVSADAEMKNKLSTEAKGAADRAIEQLAALAFAAGKLKPNYDQTLAEAPEKRKQATNRIETAAKTLDGADKEFKRAETRKSVTGHELELARQASARASNTVVSVRATLEASEANRSHIADTLAADKKAAAAAERSAIALAFSPDGRTLASQSDNGRIELWQATTGAPVEVLPPASGAPQTPPCAGVAYLDAHTVLASRGGRELAAWSLYPAWTLERTIGTGDSDSPLSDRVNAVRFSPDGQWLATGGGEPTRSGEIKLWRVADGSLSASFTNVHSDTVLALDFSPDGKHLASASADRFVRVLDPQTGKIERAFEGHTSYVLGVAWKSDSRILASAGADNVIKIWDFTTGERKKNIEGAAKEVTSISFVGITDQTLATSGDNQVRLLRENGDKVRAFEGPSDFMNSAAATANGKLIVAGGQDGVLRIWADDGSLITNFTSAAR